MTLLSVAAAQARILALAPDLPTETVPLAAAANRWAAADIFARRTQPAADLSAMDGYAIGFAELPGPWHVVGESAAGAGLGTALQPGEAARIFTGAPLPQGADTILVQEEAARDGATLRLAGEGPGRKHAHVRPAGSDFTTGTRLISRGDALTPARIALAAIGGHGQVTVRRKVRVAILSTGNELSIPGAPASGVRLPASNGPMLAAALAHLPVTLLDAGIVPDDLDALVSAFRNAAAEADIVVTTGGASVGDHDLVRPALEAAGALLDFWRVAMKPGKPLLAGRLDNCVMVGLPGNPVSAFVTAHLFLLPLVSHMAGSARPLPPVTSSLLNTALPATGSRAEYLRGIRIDGRVEQLADQDSAALLALAAADLLIVRPPNAPPAGPGTAVDTIAIA
jgi:molybdopterin molybdotransferase